MHHRLKAVKQIAVVARRALGQINKPIGYRKIEQNSLTLNGLRVEFS